MPVDRREFFGLEAGEYLERLALLVEGGSPDGESLVRYARALRGAALMAGPPGYAVAASAIENVAKGLREGSALWSPALAQELGAAVAAGKALLGRVREWSEQDIATCERTAAGLNALVGGPARRSTAAEPQVTPGQSAAVRAYIARETAALAATLEQAAAAVEQFAPEGLATAAQRLQPLRGLGALPGLSPLPELLEALDLTLAHCSKDAPPPGAARALRAAAAALACMARDIAELGLPQPDAPEVVRATEQLREAFAGEQDVVPIASLFAPQDAEPVVRRGLAPARRRPETDLAVELMSLADRLRHAAAQLRGGTAGPARSLQLFSLAFSLRGLVLSEPVAGSTGNLLCRIDRETMAGRALQEADQVAGVLDRAARALANAATAGTLASLSRELVPLCEALDRLGEDGIVPIASLGPESEADVVPIESLAPAYSPLERTFSTYHRLMQQEPAAGRGPFTAHRSPLTEVEPVAIQVLLYRGRGALLRADLVRRELSAALQTRRDLASIEALLGELLDLVPLALDDQG